MSDEARRYVVPGRIELVGKHVDYAGGRSLTCAVDRAITVDAFGYAPASPTSTAPPWRRSSSVSSQVLLQEGLLLVAG